MAGKRAVITGITGMVGSHLADYLLENTDWEVVGCARWRSPLDNVRHLLPLAEKRRRLRFHYADVNDLASLIRLFREAKPRFVFHLAAQSYPLTSFTAPADTLQTNVIGTLNVLEALRIVGGKPIVHVCASSEVFGRVVRSALPIGDDALFHPASPYAISKVGADLLGRFYAEAYGMTVMTTRMFTHTGPRRGDVFAESTFAKQIALIEAGRLAPVVKTG